MPINIYEQAARRVKADKLADTVQIESIVLADVRMMDAREWSWLAGEAKVRLPVSETTQALVIEILEARSF